MFRPICWLHKPLLGYNLDSLFALWIFLLFYFTTVNTKFVDGKKSDKMLLLKATTFLNMKHHLIQSIEIKAYYWSCELHLIG